MAELNRSITAALTADDYAIANRLFVLNSYKRPAAITTMLLLCASSAALLLALALGYELGPFGEVLQAGVPFFLVLTIVIMLLNYFLIAPDMARSTFRKQKTLHYPYTFSWSEAAAQPR